MSTGIQIAALCGLSILLVVFSIWVIARVRANPEKREKQRRLNVHKHGRLGDALITAADEETIYYKYTIRGVQYDASQDVRSLRDHLPAEPQRLIGVAGLKYATNNPANSILICEEWSGLRAPAPAADQTDQTANRGPQ